MKPNAHHLKLVQSTPEKSPGFANNLGRVGEYIQETLPSDPSRGVIYDEKFSSNGMLVTIARKGPGTSQFVFMISEDYPPSKLSHEPGDIATYYSWSQVIPGSRSEQQVWDIRWEWDKRASRVVEERGIRRQGFLPEDIESIERLMVEHATAKPRRGVR